MIYKKRNWWYWDSPQGSRKFTTKVLALTAAGMLPAEEPQMEMFDEDAAESSVQEEEPLDRKIQKPAVQKRFFPRSD